MESGNYPGYDSHYKLVNDTAILSYDEAQDTCAAMRYRGTKLAEFKGPADINQALERKSRRGKRRNIMNIVSSF